MSKRALILKFGQIGDVIMAVPAVRRLYEVGYEIDWVCGMAALPLLASYSWIRSVPVNDKKILVGTFIERSQEIINLWRRIIGTKYDLCATLYYDHRFRLLASPVRAKRKLTLSKNLRETLLLAGRHHTDEYVRVLLGIKDGYQEQSASPVRPDRLPLSPWAESNEPRRIAIVPGGTSNLLGEQVLRRWPIKNYVVLSQNLLDRGWEVMLLGGPEDAWVRPYFEQQSVKDCLGTLSLPEVVSACDACDAVITHDTGPLHLAGLSTTCLVGIFGPTDPHTRVPRRPNVVGVWGGQGFACRPCYDGRDFAPCEFNGCMHQVTPELVLRELDRLLADREQETPSPWRIVSPAAGGRDDLVYPHLV